MAGIFSSQNDDDDGFSVGTSSDEEADVDFDIHDINVPAQILRQLCSSQSDDVPEIDVNNVKQEKEDIPDVKPDINKLRLLTGLLF